MIRILFQNLFSRNYPGLLVAQFRLVTWYWLFCSRKNHRKNDLLNALFCTCRYSCISSSTNNSSSFHTMSLECVRFHFRAWNQHLGKRKGFCSPDSVSFWLQYQLIAMCKTVVFLCQINWVNNAKKIKSNQITGKKECSGQSIWSL